MNDLTFQMLLHCDYTNDNNEIGQLVVENMVKNEWQLFDLSINSAGFDVFLFAILTCQHMYFRNNAAEYGLVLNSCQGLITIITDQHRSIDSMHVEFNGRLKKGSVDADKVNSIIARMNLCPVSINLKDFLDRTTTVKFE